MLDERLQAFEKTLSVAPLQQIADSEWADHGVELWLKRDDLLHPVVSGNKWRKLKWVLNAVLHVDANHVVSMGGAYSNYLHALAYLAQHLGLSSQAYVRLDAGLPMTPTLQDLELWGMSIIRISRTAYRELRQQAPDLPNSACWLPEGGADQLALRGVGELLGEFEQSFDVLVCACGTGATLAGLVAAAPASTQVLGIAALKHADFLYTDVQTLLGERVYANWTIDLHSHLGGFANVNEELFGFMQQFERRYQVPLEPVYTGKMLLALYQKLRAGQFVRGQRVLAIHSGGLQGRRGFQVA